MTRRKRNPDDDFQIGMTCASCGKAMYIEDGLDPTPECNPCAQALLGETRAEIARLRAEVARLTRLAIPEDAEERIARWIVSTFGDRYGLPWDSTPECQRDDARDQARAVLAALAGDAGRG